MADLTNPRLIYTKGFLFLVTGLLASGLLIAENPNLSTMFLLAVVILGVNVRNATTEASGRARASKKQPPAKARTVDPDENIVDGFGTTATAAKERALVHAQERVERLLQERYRETNWKPPERRASNG